MKRAEGWIAHRADRLSYRWAEFTRRVWARGDLVRERSSVRWYRVRSQVAGGWKRSTFTDRARRESREGSAIRWFRSLAGVRRQAATGRRWLRRVTPSARTGGRHSGVARTIPIMLATSFCVVIVLTMLVSVLSRTDGPPRSLDVTVIGPRGRASGIDIPDVRGMSASQARARLERAGLTYAGAMPAIGTPGEVLWTDPNIGRSVPSNSSVTVVVGAEAERIGSPSSALRVY